MAIISEYEDRIDMVISEKDKGIYDAMNKGIEMATGDWIHFMNVGDFFYKDNTLEKLFNMPLEADLIYGKNHVDYGYFSRVAPPIPLQQLKYGMIFSHQAMIVKTGLMKANPFDTHYQMTADYNFIYNLYKEGGTLQEVDLIFAGLKAGGLSEVNIIQTYLERWNIATRYEKGLDKWKLSLRHFGGISKVFLAKTVKKILPQRLVKKLTIRKYQ